MKISLGFTFLLCILTNCSRHQLQRVADFNVTVPFKMNNGILIDAVWGNDTISTLIDNHSPSWINKNALEKIKPTPTDYTYRTTTADGAEISGKVYEAKNLRIGNALFPSVTVYLIDDGSNKPAAVIGEDILSKGALTIDFEKRMLTFSNEGVSLENSFRLNAAFTRNGISMPIEFRNNATEQVYVDLAYNKQILLPEADFNRVVDSSVYKASLNMQFATPSDKQMLQTTFCSDTVFINKRPYRAVLATNELAAEKLIGLDFFSQFKYMVIDYQNKQLSLHP